jgi:hypothetical protein
MEGAMVKRIALSILLLGGTLIVHWLAAAAARA